MLENALKSVKEAKKKPQRNARSRCTGSRNNRGSQGKSQRYEAETGQKIRTQRQGEEEARQMSENSLTDAEASAQRKRML